MEHFPGLLFRELKEALLCAFNEDSLKDMLRSRLDWFWDRIKNGDTYETRVFNLISFAEEEEKLAKLIVSAAREEYNNLKIRNFVGKHEIRSFVGKQIDNLIDPEVDGLRGESLVRLLPIIEDSNTFELILAWSKFRLDIEKHRDEIVKICENRELSNWFKCFCLLEILVKEYPQLKEGTEPTIVVSVKYLLKEERINNSIKQQLKEWLHETKYDFTDQTSESDQVFPGSSIQPKARAKELQAYLMIMVNSERTKAKVRVNASLLCICPLRGIRKEIPVNLAPGSNQRGVLCTWKKLPDTIEKFVKKSVEDELKIPDGLLGCDYYAFTIEVFLSSDYLCEPIDSWKIQDDFPGERVSLGSKHRLVVRSYDRVAKPNLKNAFSKAWHKSQEFLNQDPDAALLQQEIYCLDKIDDNQLIWLKDELKKRIGLKVICTLPKYEMVKIFRAILSSGIPFAFWNRCCELPNSEVIDGIDQFLTTELLREPGELLEKVKENRGRACACEMPEKHWGSHLSVLWDDLDRMPTLESF